MDQNEQRNVTTFSIPIKFPLTSNEEVVSSSQTLSINQGRSVCIFKPNENAQFQANPIPIIQTDFSESNQHEKNENKNQADAANFELTTNEDIITARKLIWEQYLERVKKDPIRNKEIEERCMTFETVSMKYGIKIIGSPSATGYPLYIALHGGGQSGTADMNDSQWEQMGIYYLKGLTNGIYVNPRGIRDTWDCHFNPESYPLYDRLITNMIAFYNVDPNRIYLTGYSAGGDGVYAIVARMSDRFAAANMSAGHPNGVPLYNIYNMPFFIQVGENDNDYKRNLATAQYNKLLDDYHKEMGGGFFHKCFIHFKKNHNFFDNTTECQKVIGNCEMWLENGESESIDADTNVIHLLEEFVRNPIPKRIVWDLSQRAEKRSVKNFYWICADSNIKKGRIVASFDIESNSIIVEECTAVGEITFLINNDMLDLFKPIKIIIIKTNITSIVKVKPSYDLLYQTTIEHGDFNYQFAAKFTLTF